MIKLNGHSLTLAQVRSVLYDYEPVEASAESLERVEASRRAVEKIVTENKVVYGINTGFGKLSDVLIDQKDVEKLQLNLIRSHACGVGQPFPESVSRAMLLLRANALLKGYSGVRRDVIDCLLAFVNHRIHPVIPEQGSLGASGDLAPLSHLALALVGEGEVFYKGQTVPALSALRAENIQPLTLTAKEGLALINGTQAMTAMGTVTYLEAEQLAYQAELIAAVTMEGLRGITDAFTEEVHIARGYPEQVAVAERMRGYLADSQLTTRQGQLRVQDAYSLRCIPQVHGASWQALGYVKEKLEIEMNAATDNPLIFDEGDKVISGGNFHGQPIALAMDFLKIAVAELANISERRIERMVNPQLSGLPAFLSPQPGLQSGAMILQYCAASLVSENKTLAHPASVDSIPSSANQEDHVSMGTIGARHAHQIVQNCRRVLSIELICALQSAEYQGVEKMASKTKQFHVQARKITAPLKEDRIFSKDIEAVAEFLKQTSVQTITGTSFFKEVS
ncbi:histidine ammonia-lyase [Aneurinibacillus migulanus]|uniref:histidine ammonia-lyase n=1 Tax=Aneurinibacillus migulanus TaxID=47500 RepID=UPI0005B78512|nr:histidine ammonia-lyase [Aneurinibacillus migulanus]KIV51102.1 histidine ammonia-lyase [Aneurinibacillus migulanus]KPD09443.1 histidine ammonia-lyase [Aneurinibacillus migulanus]MCP1356784.1 histidine ammonia-lyase [Aneurinibacillus migulanus]CEH31507.1 Histidine ammonia-lyase (Histidase) [Aneurinibacillus migulanus]